MNKVLLGVLLGGALGVLDGLSALVSAPETQAEIFTIVLGSTIKGIVAGLAIGYFSRAVDSLVAGIVVGLGVGLLLAWPIAYLNALQGKHYYWQIMLPGGALGTIVGFATQRYGIRRRRIDPAARPMPRS